MLAFPSNHYKDKFGVRKSTPKLNAYVVSIIVISLGWFLVFTEDPNVELPILIVSIVENVKEVGKSGYVVKKVSDVLDQYLQ